jgi:hypothetical protein
MHSEYRPAENELFSQSGNMAGAGPSSVYEQCGAKPEVDQRHRPWLTIALEHDHLEYQPGNLPQCLFALLDDVVERFDVLLVGSFSSVTFPKGFKQVHGVKMWFSPFQRAASLYYRCNPKLQSLVSGSLHHASCASAHLCI